MLLQVVFHARMAQEGGDEPFDVDDVAAGIVAKLVRRHPHVFAAQPDPADGPDGPSRPRATTGRRRPRGPQPRCRPAGTSSRPPRRAGPASWTASRWHCRHWPAPTRCWAGWSGPAFWPTSWPSRSGIPVADQAIALVRAAAGRRGGRRVRAARRGARARTSAAAARGDGVTQESTVPESFRRTARTALDVLLESDPASATALGDHRFDRQLPDLSPDGVQRTLRELADATGALDNLDESQLEPQDGVDLEMLRTRLTARAWALDRARRADLGPAAHPARFGDLPPGRPGHRRAGRARSRRAGPAGGGARLPRDGARPAGRDAPGARGDRGAADPRCRRAARRAAGRPAGPGRHAAAGSGRRALGRRRGARAARSLAHRPAAGVPPRPPARGAGLRGPALVQPGHRDQPGRPAGPGRERPDVRGGGDRRGRGPARAAARRPRPDQHGCAPCWTRWRPARRSPTRRCWTGAARTWTSSPRWSSSTTWSACRTTPSR